jgi:hypothetical protein
MSKVYVVQKQMTFDTSVGDFVPRFDLTAAEHYGEFVYLLSPVASPFKAGDFVTEIRERLQDFTSDDFLLLLGNPCFIGLCTAIAAKSSGGTVNLLQWNNKAGIYEKIKVTGLI